MKYARILAEFYATPWAILPDRLAVIAAVLHRAAAGIKLSDEEIQAAVGDAPEKTAARHAQSNAAGGGGVMVLPLFGLISHRIHQVQDISGPGGTSTEGFARHLREAVNDPQVGSIVIDIDSPGGSVYGVPELADEIFAAREKKKIVAVANSLAASAAYWIGAAAQELVVTPSGEIGSIGVFAAHEDWSKNLEDFGVDVTLISAGKHKTEGNPYEPLTDEARDAIQKSVNEYYDMFVKGVAKSRDVKTTDVREGFGQGRVIGARESVTLGMADRVATLDETIARLAKGGRLKTGKRVAANRNETTLAEKL